MSLFGFNASKNPPTLTGSEDGTISSATINDLTITDKLYFKQLTNNATGNSAFNMSVDPTTENLTINTPSASSIKFVQGGLAGQSTIFGINPTSLNYNVGATLKTLPYSQLDNISGSTSNIQTQINNISSSLGVAYWGTFWCSDTITTTGGGTPENAYLQSNDPNGNGFNFADQIGTSLNYESVQVDNEGFYSMSLQLRGAHTITSTEQFRGFLYLNGSIINETTCYNTLPAANSVFTETYNSIVINWNMKLNAGDKISPMWGSFTSNIYLQPDTPNQPSVLFTIQQITNTTAGPKGDTGDPGDAATVAVGVVTTLPATNSAYVTNSGTAYAATLNFGIPQGIQGVQGPKGDKGDPGDPGDLSNYATHTEVLSVSAAAASAAGIAATAASNAYTNTVAAGLQGEITANGAAISTLQSQTASNGTSITALQSKTQNQTAVPSITTFSGSLETTTVVADTVNAGTVDTDNIVLTTTLSGIGKLQLSSTTGAHLIQAPSTTITSYGGAGGVYLGGFTDIVYINGFPFSTYFQQFS